MYKKIFDPVNKKFVNSYSKEGISLVNTYNSSLYGGSSVTDNEEKLTNGRLKLEKNLLQTFDNKENVDQFKKILYSTNSLLAGGFLVRSYSDYDSDMGDLDIYVQNKHAVSMLLYLNSVGFEMEFWNMAPPYDQSFFRKNNIMSRTYLEKNNYEQRDYQSWNEGDTVLVKSMWKSADRTLFAVDFEDSALWGTSKAIIKRKILGENPDEIYIVSWVDDDDARKDSIVYRNDIFSLKNISCDLMIIPDFIEPKQVVQNFDLTFCEIWFDGKTVDATDIDGVLNKKGFLRKEYTDSLLTKFNKFLIDRIKRYSKRGFNITINTQQDSYNINADEIVNLNKSYGYRTPKVESYEAWFVTQVYKALICTRSRWNFQLIRGQISLTDDLTILRKKNYLINWLWMVQNPLQKRTINNLVEICEKTNEIDTIAKFYDDNVNHDLHNDYFYSESNILTSIQKYWFILLHFNSHKHKRWVVGDESKSIYSRISCTLEGHAKYGSVLQKNKFIPYEIIAPINIKNRKVIGDNEILQKILPSQYKEEIAKHTNINWDNKEDILSLFYNNSGKFEPNLKLIIDAFSFVNDEKYEQYTSYLRKINVFLGHPLNYIYKNPDSEDKFDLNLFKFWKEQKNIESLHILNIDESVYKTCLDFLNIEDDIELERSKEMIDLEKRLFEVNEERGKAMLARDIPKYNEYDNLSKKLKNQLDIMEEELNKDNIKPGHRYINSWVDVDEQFVIILGGEPICYNISQVLDSTRDYYRWVFECTGDLNKIEEGESEREARIERGIEYTPKYNRAWWPAPPTGGIVPFTGFGNVLYAALVVDNDIGGYVYVDVNELRSMILHVVMDGIKVFHFTDEKTITHTVAFNAVYDPEFDQVGQSHCQFGTNIMCYNIKICNGTKCIPGKEPTSSHNRLAWPANRPKAARKQGRLSALPDDGPLSGQRRPESSSTHSKFSNFELIMNHPFK